MGRMRLEMEILEPIVENLQLPLEALVSENARWLRGNPGAPWLYSSGVRYQMEGAHPHIPGRPDERFEPIPRVIELGEGDCEDLAAWRAAELRVRGFSPEDPRLFPRARAFAVRSGRTVIEGLGPVNLIHILVSRDGSCELSQIEDPSARLGMEPLTPEQLRAAVGADCAPGFYCESRPTVPSARQALRLTAPIPTARRVSRPGLMLRAVAGARANRQMWEALARAYRQRGR